MSTRDYHAEAREMLHELAVKHDAPELVLVDVIAAVAAWGEQIAAELQAELAAQKQANRVLGEGFNKMQAELAVAREDKERFYRDAVYHRVRVEELKEELAAAREEFAAAIRSGNIVMDNLHNFERGIIEIFLPNFNQDGMAPADTVGYVREQFNNLYAQLTAAQADLAAAREEVTEWKRRYHAAKESQEAFAGRFIHAQAEAKAARDDLDKWKTQYELLADVGVKNAYQNGRATALRECLEAANELRLQNGGIIVEAIAAKIALDEAPASKVK